MKIWFLVAAVAALTACSEAPTQTQANTPAKLPEPITGRQAFQYTFPQARRWALDAEPIEIRNLNLDQVKSEDGKAGAWQITYVSMQRGRARVYTWSAIESGESLHKGVFASPEESWSARGGLNQPFSPAALKVDSPAALQTAVAHSKDYLDRPGARPQVTFLLELTPRFADPAWRVLWGNSASSAEYSVFVDATTGRFLQRVR
ncbi:MAG TPA: hypothetical protein VFW83_03425 [Bryobacteraceae bacterium]|nr:hypothetical protein [Bryobacteraceae bacterium]